MADEQQTEERQDEQDEQRDTGPAARAREKEEAWEKASEKVRKMEEEDEPPTDLAEWPDDEAKYITFGGGEGDHGYDEGPEKKLGPSSLERHDDGRVTIEGEEVDNPEDYKADPVTAAVDTPTPGDHDDDDEDSREEDSDSGDGARE
ncbi:MAG TPA: hypothetical protein VGR12_07740 [Solirubrobacteraceae bacterium]|nr:hypothetical protein [Solirubrobacteraceae bacterium]